MELQIEGSPALAAPGSWEMRSAGEPIYSQDGHRPAKPQARKILSADQERRLAERWQKELDLRARGELVEAFQPLVRKQACRFKTAVLALDDLIQCANIGLIKAIDRFDPSKARLSTYAVWWIEAELKSFVRDNSGPIKTPKGQPIERGESLNEPFQFDDGDKAQRQDFLAHDPADQESALAEAGEIARLRDRLVEVMDDCLDKRERTIFEARCLSDDPPTLDDLGKQFSVSRERVRQIQAIATNKVERAAKQPLKISNDARLYIARWPSFMQQLSRDIMISTVGLTQSSGAFPKPRRQNVSPRIVTPRSWVRLSSKSDNRTITVCRAGSGPNLRH